LTIPREIDPDLAIVVEAWPALSAKTRQAILALVEDDV
jgi:hypothetical protein